MSRSYRTQKESVIAARRIARKLDGSVKLPRIIERAPAPGDIHPLSKRILSRLLSKLPVEYLYGLTRIELRARQVPAIGEPFGSYWPGEHAIILYSLPRVWHIPSISRDIAESLVRFKADVQLGQDSVEVTWNNDAMLGIWYYCDVFTHELGHHFVEQYKTKNGAVHGRRFEEIVADLHARRFTEDLFAKFRRKKALGKSA